jgi:hypothetical protein
MSGAWIAAAALAAAAAGTGIALRETRWRRLVLRELPEEIGWGALDESDIDALSSWKRFRRGWLQGRRERRAVRVIAARLARAKIVQRRAAGARGRLLQVEILSLRTRLRRSREGGLPAAGQS